MAEYTDGIERINIELSLRNKIALCDALTYLLSHGALPLGEVSEDSEAPSPELLQERVTQALELLHEVKSRWSAWLIGIDHFFPDLQSHSLRASWKTELRQPLHSLFNGVAFAPLRQALDATHQRVLKGRVGCFAYACR